VGRSRLPPSEWATVSYSLEGKSGKGNAMRSAAKTSRLFAVGALSIGLALASEADAQAPDFDSDGVPDGVDNCSEVFNQWQDDTDADDCGNLCDADYDDSGRVGMADFNEFRTAFFTTGDDEKCHVEPTARCTVGFPDFTIFASLFLSIPGPSGTTTGTTACP
jgi:hypothetical protein